MRRFVLKSPFLVGRICAVGGDAMAKMKAVMKVKRGRGFEIVDVDVPRPGPHDLLVKVRLAGICGSDSHIYAWDEWASQRIKPPMIVGHEFCGEVVEMGSEVRGFKVGDYVSAESHIPCGYCYQCRNDQQHICANLKILGVDTDGCFAEYALIPDVCAWKNPPDMDPEIAAIQEPLGNSVYAVLEADVVGRSVCVFGCGPAGMFASAVAVAAGAYPVVSVIKHEFRRHILQQLGVHHIIHKDEDVVTFVKDLTHGVGVDVVCEMTGNQQAINTGFEVVRKGGTFVAFGIPAASVSLPFAEGVIFKGVNVMGINGRLMFKTWFKMRALLESGRLNPKPIITHRFRMEEIDTAMKQAKSPDRRVGKIILEPFSS